MFKLKICSVENQNELGKLREFVLESPGRYPNFSEWVNEKCFPRIESGEYKNFCAFFNEKIKGDLIYRFISESQIEIKNLRVDKNFRRKGLGRILMNCLRIENSDKILLTDVNIKNFSAVKFFLKYGFDIKSIEEFYKKGQEEYILEFILRSRQSYFEN